MPDNLKPGTYLGFDYGLKRIGVAIGQTISKSASALEIIPANNDTQWQRIDQLIQEWRPVGIVIGVPATADGKTGKIHQLIKRFTEQIETRFQLPIYEIDERLSSFAARDLLSTTTQRKIARLDDTAAAVILQSWFNEQA